MKKETNLPVEFVQFVKDLLHTSTFIETGTGLGNTTAVAAKMFTHVYTIEVHRGRWEQAVDRFARWPNVQCVHGDSAYKLREVLRVTVTPSIIFLDAHCAYRPLAAPSACVLLDEIAAVLESSCQHVMVIDDLPWFASVPPKAEYREHYPELPQVIDALRAEGCNPFIFSLGNCLITVPRAVKESVESFLREDDR